MKHIKSCKCGKHLVKSSVDWSEFDTPESNEINEMYLPNEGEGDTMATQAVTAVNKLISQWYNNGEVFDNRGGFGSTVNECSSYANWLANYVDGAEDILEFTCDTNFESHYEDGLKRLFDFVFNKSLLEELANKPAVSSIYDETGSFSTDHVVCAECGEEDEDMINPESGDGELENMIWEELARRDGFDDLFEYSYGEYYPKDNSLVDLYNDWYQDWFREHDETSICRNCASSLASEAADYIENNMDWYDEEGYDKRTGFNDDGFDREGYDQDGFKDGRNRDGYDKEGYDENGLDRHGLTRDKKMGSKKALKHFLGVDPDEDLTHDANYYKK